MEDIIYYFEKETEIGTIYISADQFYIKEVRLKNNEIEKGINRETNLIHDAFTQIYEYLNRKRKYFDLPLKPIGTEFQTTVWNELLKIPYGEICSYQDIAIRIGTPKATRAVGGANNKNPIFIIIPCHRVIGKNGSLTGYADGLDLKKYLLELEKNNVNN